MRLGAGSPEPLGVTPDADGVNVAVVAGEASAVDFCLFDDDGHEQRVRLPERTGPVFHGHVAGVSAGARYGLRAHGAFEPDRGLRFDATKLLTDPHAAALDGAFRLSPALFAPPEAGLDSAPRVPKAIVTPPAAPAAPLRLVPWADTVIYEAQVRALTMRHPDVPPAIRGRFAGLASPPILEHLQRLGVTTLELLPVAAWVDERHLPPLGLTNAWGYNPVAFGAPDPRLAPGGWPEVRAAVAALAEAGIEVVLDVVFNHTGEGDALGPTLSLRGLDNAGYYRLDPGDPAAYVNDAGTGNILRADNPQVVRLVMDSLRAWARRGGVAGFRFDLATVLGRRAEGFDPDAPLLSAIVQDPELRALKLIAEPWDCGPGGHQLGRFPPEFAEWNDRYRDGVRRFWGRQGATRGDLAARLAGSQDIFGRKGRPSRSVNYVTAHDGFTLADLVSHEAKHNEANGEAGRDGADTNWSWNNGVEGPSDDQSVTSRRARDRRALLALLLLSRGTPMLAMGDELGRTQGGNNNAYAQDNATTWVDWAAADLELADFVARLTRARRDHPGLAADWFLTGEDAHGQAPDVLWLDAEAEPLSEAAWDDPNGSVLQVVLSAPAAAGGLDRVDLILNRGDSELEAALPEPLAADWRLVLDSADPRRKPETVHGTVAIAPRSVTLLAETRTRGRAARADDALVAEVAAAAGIAPAWWTLEGRERRVTPETQRALLSAMGFPALTRDEARESLRRIGAPGRAALPPVQVVPAGRAVRVPVRGPEAWLTLAGAAGDPQRIPVREGHAELPPLPAGRYRLQLDSAEGVLIVAPATAHEPSALADGASLFGVSAQLYGVRRRGDQGVGDLTTLARVGKAVRREGAALLAINPLHMLFPQDRERVSPYHPSDRRFIDPLYLDVAGGEDAPRAGARGRGLLDYGAAWARKRARLEAVLAREPNPPMFARFREEGGEALHRFVLFQAIAEVQPGPWRTWPAGLQDPTSPAARAFAAEHAERMLWHARLQFEADRQLATAAAEAPPLGLCRDLAVGAAPDGAEVWSDQGLWALSASIGAPPDAFAPQGQVWGLPPPRPAAWRDAAYAPFSELLRANMRHAGALRIDHVLGLQRLFWVPEGAQGEEGAYVDYPLEDLLGVLALESDEARCLVVGEDLGTVPDGLREALRQRRIYGYTVLPFEKDAERFRPPGAYRAKAVACAATHDLPPLAGWWAAEDLAERLALGLLAPGDLAAAEAARRDEKQRLLEALDQAGIPAGADRDGPFTDVLAAAIMRFLAVSEAQLVLVQAEDLAGQVASQNVPGTDRERPNWRLCLPGDLDALVASHRARAMFAALAGRDTN